MGIEIMEMNMKLRKFGIFLLRKSYRSVYNHPFLVCMLLFLVFLYRSSPFLFSLLVSASPVLVCTAVLLGILLSFGQPNLPEIENDEKLVNETGSLRTGIRTDTIVEKSEEYSVEKVSHKNLEITEHLNADTNFVADTDKLDSSISITEEYREIQDVVDRKIKVVDKDDELEFEMDKSPAESIDSKRVNVDSLDSPPDSPWKHTEEDERGGDEVEEDDDNDDDDSDQAESSSPDASMADIIPLLDELHPLLDDDAPHPVPFSHDGSDAASERSDESNDSGSISDDNIEKHEDLEEEDEGVDEDEEEEEQYNKESETKTAITWTEEDQKNLMDLGSSELERNQRLESLIARRRAKKCVSMMPERNLIDFDSTDLPFNIAPISTSRNNPFDIGHDSYGNNTSLPPIPGSAPSILLPRRNPFDIPYDSSEEKPNLMTDSFQQEFSSSQQKNTFFRRRESFNVGPSFFGPNRYDNNRFKPFFVPEKSYLEESSYSPFQRQSSGLSDSKASSVPETDSVVSTGDIEENNDLVVEDNVTQKTVTVNFVPELELTSQTGNLESKNSFGEDICEALEKETIMTEENEDFTQENEVIVKMEDVSEHVGHGSQSSSSEEDDGSSLENDEIEDRVTGLDNGDDIHKTEQLKLHKDADVPPLSVEGRHFNEESQMPPGEHSLHGSNTNNEIGSVCGDPHHNHKEPIYDSSPTSIAKNASSSSILSSEINAESNMMGFPPVLIKGPVLSAEIDSESEGPKLEGTTNTSKIDLQLRDKGYDSTTFMPVGTEFSGSQSLVGMSIDADQNIESTGSSSRNIDTVISTGSSSKNTDAVISVEPDEKEIQANGQNSTEDKSFPDFGEELIFLDRNMDETPDQHGVQEETLEMQEEISEESSPRGSLNVSDVQEIETETVSANVNFPTSPESINISSEAYESRAVECYSDDEFENDDQFHAMENREEMQNVDYVEEIGEDLLSELDTVGDFSVKNLDSDTDLSAMNMPVSSSNLDDLEIPEKITISEKENEPNFVESKVLENSSLEDFEMPLIEAQSLEDIKSVFKKSEASTNGEIEVDRYEELHEDQDSKKSTTFETRSTDDIKTIIKKTELTDENVVDDSVKPHEDQTSSMDVSSEMPGNEETRSTSDIQKNELNSSEMSNKSQPIETTSSKTPVDSEVLVNDEQTNENESVAQVSINNVDMKSDANVPETSILTSGNDLEKKEAGISNDEQLSMKQPVLRENTEVNSDAIIAITEEGSAVLHDQDNEKHSKK